MGQSQRKHFAASSKYIYIYLFIYVYYNRFREVIVESRELRERQDMELRASVSWSTTAAVIVEK